MGSIKVVRSGKVNKAKLYYLRDRKGKSARITEKIKKKIGIDISEQVIEKEIKQETEFTENKPKVEMKKEEPKKENSIKEEKSAALKAELKKEKK